jgi:riboflavin kinase / FMN adenylyltransferase
MKNKKFPVKVRRALGEGNIKEANRMLGSPFAICGLVVKGQQLGRVLGFPTANLKLNHGSPLFLANGVYAVKVSFEKNIYHGMANIGIRPTLEQHELTVEVNIFDFEGDLYSREILVHFIERVRDEKKFGSLDELKEQIARDKVTVTEILSTAV